MNTVHLRITDVIIIDVVISNNVVLVIHNFDNFEIQVNIPVSIDYNINNTTETTISLV